MARCCTPPSRAPTWQSRGAPRPARTWSAIAIRCAALQPSQIESELFGPGGGAFPGAQQAPRGLFREARGGTLFLDEIYRWIDAHGIADRR